MYSLVPLLTSQISNSHMWLMTSMQWTTDTRAFTSLVESCLLNRTSVQLLNLGHILKILMRS